MPAKSGETYLGDAVYASFDGYQIRLRTGDRNNQVIYMDPSILTALFGYWGEIRREQEALMNGETLAD